MKILSKISEDDLLQLRIRELELEIESSDLLPWISEVLDELKDRKIGIRPLIYFGDEWFSPEGTNAVAIPFFLGDSRLRELEKKFMLDCEGSEKQQFKRLLRHEIGHTFDHAFKVSRRRKWSKLFGSPAQEYLPEAYRPKPYSKNFVQNIGGFYAQAHPDEDFAETFAVWLDPHSNWKSRYRNWGALKKLSYVDSLVTEFVDREVPPARGRMMSDARRLNSTLNHYYKKKRKFLAEDLPDYFDRDLLKIFSRVSVGISATQFLKKNRKTIIQTMSQWTGERKTIVSDILQRIIKRTEELRLHLPENQAKALMDIAAFLASIVSHYLFTGHFRRKSSRR